MKPRPSNYLVKWGIGNVEEGRYELPPILHAALAFVKADFDLTDEQIETLRTVGRLTHFPQYCDSYDWIRFDVLYK